MNLKKIAYDLTALLAGALLTLSFAPFGIYSLAVFCPAYLLATWLTASPGRSFWRGWLFGVGLYTSGVYWIFISIHTYGNTSIEIAMGLTAAMIAFLALYTGLNGYLLNRFFPRNNFTKIVLAFPALWVLLEWIRSWFLSGFPWLLIGCSQITSPLKGFAPLLGTYGVSLAVVISSGLVVLITKTIIQQPYKKAIFPLSMLVALWLSGAVLSLVSWTHPAAQPIKVSLVQGNIPQELKWTPDQVMPTLVRYVDLTRPHWDSHIIIWPESAVPLPMQSAKEFLDPLTQEALKHNTTIITGIPIKAPQNEGYYNGIITLGKGEGMYTKQRLVPFGEYIPFRRWLGQVMDFLQVPMSDFIPGEKTQPILVQGLKIASFVCYEIAYPQQVLSRDGNIGLILTISNDAWFGKSIAQAQHAEMAQMRALEMGRPVLFVGNDGITAIINSKGKIQSRAPQHEIYVLTDEVQTTTGRTPWQYAAMYPVYGLIILFLFLALRGRERTC